jgi:5-methylcytosine-specific restriction protein A
MFMIKEYFETYLRINRNVSERTVKHYFTGLNTITILINKYNVFSRHIFDVETIEELINIKEFLNSNQEFLIKDSTGNSVKNILDWR